MLSALIIGFDVNVAFFFLVLVWVGRNGREYHALEYGFPSSHCTSTTSIAIYYFLFLLRIGVESPLAWWGGGSRPYLSFIHSFPVSFFLKSRNSLTHTHLYEVVLFTWSNVCFGRLYCGMHSSYDCLFGILLGGLLTTLVTHLQPTLEHLLVSPSISVPFSIFLLTISLSTFRPNPPIPCPCFGDAVAFFSVVSGTSLARWLEVFLMEDAWSPALDEGWKGMEEGDGSGRLRGWEGWYVWVLLAGGKYLFGPFFPSPFIHFTSRGNVGSDLFGGCVCGRDRADYYV